MKINIKKLYEDSILPLRGSEQAAGVDLYAHHFVDYEDVENLIGIYIQPHETLKINTGIALEIPEGYGGLVLPRSGLATKRSLRVENTPGLIDADYRGPIIVALHNDSNKPQQVDIGERIAQLMIVPFLTPDFEVVDELSTTDRGDKGFGSSGTK